MKKYLMFSVAFMFAGLLFTSPRVLRSVSAKRPRPQFASDRLLVKYRTEVEDREIERDITERVLPASRSQIESLHTNALGKFYVVKLSNGLSVEEAASILRQSPN